MLSAILGNMKIIVTHTAPDWDAIGSVWLLKKYLAGWQEAQVEFVPAGQRSPKVDGIDITEGSPIVTIGGNEIIHVDTGLGPLDHHQIYDTSVSATSRTWDFVQQQLGDSGESLTPEHGEAISRIVKVIVETDHFKEVFWKDAAADYQEFSLLGVLEGLKIYKPNEDDYYISFGIESLNALQHTFENRIWAEKEIKNGHEFRTATYGRGIGFETINDTVLKLAQKMGYEMVVRKDPRKGYVRIKVRPAADGQAGMDLTPVYEKLKAVDTKATWYLHVSKKMLLNGTPKNPKMIPTTLSLVEIIKVLENV